MKGKEVRKILNIARSTLYLYTKNNILKYKKLDNGYYDYDEESIFKLLKKNSRINVIYARVSTHKQNNDLERQINKIKKFCDSNKVIVSKIYSEIDSGINLDRNQLSSLIDKEIDQDKLKEKY